MPIRPPHRPTIMEVYGPRRAEVDPAGYQIITSSQNAGRSAVLPPDNILQTILQAQGADQQSSVMTVTLSASPVTPPTGGNTFRPRAVVQWGAGGFQHEAEVDVIRGTVLSVAASFIRISGANEGTGISVNIGATVGYMPHAGGHSPTRTVYQPAVDADSNYAFVVPNFASSFTFYRVYLETAFLLQLVTQEGNEIGEWWVESGENAPPNILLANDVRTVYVRPMPDSTGDGGATFDGSRCVFHLDL